jgi:hypothetical protein
MLEQGCVHAAKRDVCSRGVAGIRRLAPDQPLDELLKQRLGYSTAPFDAGRLVDCSPARSANQPPGGVPTRCGLPPRYRPPAVAL